jgi:hypothetical protein
MGKVNSDEPAMIECKDKLLSQQTQINEVVRILFAYIAILVVLFNPIANLFRPLESCPSSVAIDQIRKLRRQTCRASLLLRRARDSRRGGKGKPRYTAKRQLGKDHTPRPLAFNSDHITPEAKEKLCELEEEQQFQDSLAKEAAAKAAIAAQQTKVLYQISNLERKQEGINKKKQELVNKYKDTLVAHASSSSIAVNTVSITPPDTPVKGRTEHFRLVFKQLELMKGNEELEKRKLELIKENELLEKQKKEKEDEDKLLDDVNSMDIETIV